MRHIGRGITLAALTLSAVAFAHPDSRTLVKFEGAIGVDPLTAAGVSPGSVDVVNVVRGIQPGEEPGVGNLSVKNGQPTSLNS